MKHAGDVRELTDEELGSVCGGSDGCGRGSDLWQSIKSAVAVSAIIITAGTAVAQVGGAVIGAGAAVGKA